MVAPFPIATEPTAESTLMTIILSEDTSTEGTFLCLPAAMPDRIHTTISSLENLLSTHPISEDRLEHLDSMDEQADHFLEDVNAGIYHADGWEFVQAAQEMRSWAIEISQFKNDVQEMREWVMNLMP